jgi:hypothetical protein
MSPEGCSKALKVMSPEGLVTARTRSGSKTTQLGGSLAIFVAKSCCVSWRRKEKSKGPSPGPNRDSHNCGDHHDANNQAPTEENVATIRNRGHS